MKLSDVFQSVAALLSRPAAEIKFKNLTVESLTSQISDIKTLLKSTDAAYSELPVKQLETIYEQATDKLKMDRGLVGSVGKPTAEFLSDLPKRLTGKARSLGLFPAIHHTSKVVNKLLDELYDNLDNLLINKKHVTINDVQISHGLFLGVIQAARIFAEFNGYLLATVSHVATSRDSKVTTPRYILLYIAENGGTFTDLVNHLCNASGRYSVINEITGIRKNGLDFKMSAVDRTVNRQLFSVLGIENPFLTIFGMAIRAISLFGEIYVDVRHNYYQGIKEKKKWLEAHTALIKMELEGVDPNDPEYIKMRKMIEFYEDKIAELDKKLQSYTN